MQKKWFYQLGRGIYTLRWFIIVLWFMAVIACLPFLPDIIAPFKTVGFVDESAKSTAVAKDLDNRLGYNRYNKFIIIYHSSKLRATDPLFNEKIKKSLKKLKNFPIKHDILYPGKNQIAKDKRTASVVIILKSKEPISNQRLAEFKALIKPPPNMTMHVGGEPVFVEKVNKQTQEDLYHADFIALPLAIVTLIIVFGSLVAALVPIVLGGCCALILLTTLYFLGHIFTLSVFTLNIALLLGLCLSLDYCLFIISRFRDELLKGLAIEEAIAVMQATAGKAIFFSGLAVFASLSALLLFPINILFSVAIGGLTAVFVAVLTAIILLPALLAVLKHRINFLRIGRMVRGNRSSAWHRLAEQVVHRPYFFLFFILSVLLLLSAPVVTAKFGISDFRIFPAKSENREFFDLYSQKFNKNELSPITLVIKASNDPLLSKTNISKIYNLSRDLQENPRIKKINSIVTLDPNFNKQQYYNLYVVNKKNLDDTLKKLLKTTTTQDLTVFYIISKYPNNSPETKTLISELRDLKPPRGLELSLTGPPVGNLDVIEKIRHTLPYAVLWIMVFTFLILLFLLRSVVLPIKAILVNLLSLSACYGALVLVFQDGYFHQLLNFEPQGMLDISLLVIIFCALFGFSMDYEVFLLSRIKEFYDATKNNKKSIVFGIEKSSRIITSAALIVIFICGSFLVADVLMVKAFGLGIAVAIFVDAFLIRTFLVPAIMTILQHWNWYLPKWLDRILPGRI